MLEGAAWIRGGNGAPEEGVLKALTHFPGCKGMKKERAPLVGKRERRKRRYEKGSPAFPGVENGNPAQLRGGGGGRRRAFSRSITKKKNLKTPKSLFGVQVVWKGRGPDLEPERGKE